MVCPSSPRGTASDGLSASSNAANGCAQQHEFQDHHAPCAHTQGAQVLAIPLKHLPMLTHESNEFAGKILDNLIDVRLLREENQSWIEKAVITRVWVSTTDVSDNIIEHLRELFGTVSSNAQTSLSAPATHAAQTVRDGACGA